MRIGGEQAIVAWAFVLLGVFFPTVVKSQMPPMKDKPPEDYYVVPSLSVGEVYDDNLFFSPTSRREGDWFTRVSPNIQAGYQSTPLTLMAHYTFDSEVYNEHQELTTAQMRQQASIELKSRPSPMLTLSAKGDYFQTRTPFELNALTGTGVAVRRIRADSFSANPALEYRLDSLTKAKGDYLYSKYLIEGGISIGTQIASLDLDRRITAHDTVGPGYIGRHFTFAGFGSVTSHAFTLEWSRDLTAHTKMSLRAGPRFTAGALDSKPEALAKIEHKLEGGELSFTYSSSLTTMVGQGDPATAESYGISGSYEPLQHLRVSIGPTLFKATSRTFTTTVSLVNFEATYQMTKELALKTSYLFYLQKGRFNPLTGSTAIDEEILRDLVWFGLVFTYPLRLDYLE